jgi:hypothetical protein
MATGTLSVVVGLCGAGKTWLLLRLSKASRKSALFDEGLTDRGKKGAARRQEIAECLLAGYDVFAADLWLGYEPKRKAVAAHLRKLVPDIRILWYFYEVNLPAANANCRLRRDDPEGHIEINKGWAPYMTAPADAIILRIHTGHAYIEQMGRLVATTEKKRRRRTVVERLVGQ